MKSVLVVLIPILLVIQPAAGQTSVRTGPAGGNYDEAKVGTYTLPDPLRTEAGRRITSRPEWARRRTELLRLFAQNVYGQTPDARVRLRFETRGVDSSARGGRAVRRQVSIFFADYPQLPPIDVLLYVPKAVRRPVPVFVGLNFCGNHCITEEADIPLSDRWMSNAIGDVSKANRNGGPRATEQSRGMQARRWPIDTILQRGYALATAYYGDLEPDYLQGWHTGIRSVLGDTSRADNWGAIGAWAWGLSRMLDYLQTDPGVDAKRAIVIGHSRLGKAALWAGAQDERFAAVVANESGEGGAALARRNYGETIERITRVFPHWFCGRYSTYGNHVANLPVDQHELLALIAPRPLYVASADDDQWSDPKGEFLGAAGVEPVYRLFGKTGLGSAAFPSVNQPVGQTVRYHDRTGKHDVTIYDWMQYLRFADDLVR